MYFLKTCVYMRQKTFFPGMNHDIMMSSESNASAFHCLINIISFFFSSIVQSSRYHINYPIDVNCSDNKQKLCISKLSKTEYFIFGFHSGNFGDIIAIWNHQSNYGYGNSFCINGWSRIYNNIRNSFIILLYVIVSND